MVTGKAFQTEGAAAWRVVLDAGFLRKDLSQSLEKWRQTRSEWVETLDNLLILQTDRIRAWLQGSVTEEERQLGERTLEYLQLSQQERHLSVQALQSALGMRTFNSSLEFDHNTNQMQLQQLDELQGKLHLMLHEPGVYLHAAPASTDLVRDFLQDELGTLVLHEPSLAPAASVDEQDYDLCHEGGKSLHRCGKVINLSQGHEAQGPDVPSASRSWMAAHDGESKDSAGAASDSRVHPSPDNIDNDNTDYGEDSLYDEDDEEVLVGAVASMGSGRALNPVTRVRSSGPLRRRRTSELLAKGDTDSKVDVVPTVRSNTNQTSPLATPVPAVRS
nr:hypothetical protein BaRGS_029311 [Batillaria attramentaria]